MKVDILGAQVDPVTMADSITLIQEAINQGRSSRSNNQPININHIITLNAEIIYQAQEQPELMEIINRADLVTPDGAGVVWAAQQLGTPVPQRVTGIDLLQELAREGAHQGWKLAFFGGAPGVAQEAKVKLTHQHPQLQIIQVNHGYIKTQEEEDQLIDQINVSQPDILAVALGAPKQEFWINQHRDRLQVPVVIGVGGSFDVLAGRVTRAPRWMQQAKLEWFYRLAKEPWRYKRMLALPKFMLKVLKAKGKKN